MDLERRPGLRDLQQRRAQRRRELRARRLRALAAGVLAIALIAVAVAFAAGSLGGSSSLAAHRAPAGTAARDAAGRHAHAATGTPATSAVDERGTGRPGTASVPILMYHVIAPAPADAHFPGLYVPAPEFAAQMRALSEHGWHAVTLDQLEAYWQRGVPLGPGRPIVITFDNGYQSQYSNALPVLQSLHWTGDLNIQLTGLPPSEGGLSHREVRALIAAGWELDTQGFSHADLITLSPSQLHYQVAVARRAVQQLYHVPVLWFCYPSGHYNAEVVAAVKAAGYVGSTTVIAGWNHPGQDPYRLERIRVLGGTSASALLDLIEADRDDGPPPSAYPDAATS